MRVLIADTDETDLEILQTFLGQNGYETEIASDALECVALLREFNPHVLVLGAGLLWGGSDGVLAYLKSDRRFRNLHVILSAVSPKEFETVSLQRPVGWLEKPFRLVDLVWRLEVLEAFVDAAFEQEVQMTVLSHRIGNIHKGVQSRVNSTCVG
jgi:DNA-binding response OmpR family regulator